MAADLLARLLREWRGRITLAQVGLPERRGSRTGTLTQEDLAHLTGYSVRAISALEQGVPHRATPELVDALAAALRLSPDERHTLWYLAAGMPPPASAPLPAGIDPGLARLVEVTDPHPAFVADAARRILAQNQAAADWFNLLDMPEDQRNATYWVFLSPHARHVFVHWETEAAQVSLGIMRSQLVRWPHDERISSAVSRLCELSPDARRLWHTSGAIAPYPGPGLTMRPPGHTDPAQADDEKYHVRATAVRVVSVRPDTDAGLSVFLLPAEHARRYPVSSRQACAACDREARLASASSRTSTGRAIGSHSYAAGAAGSVRNGSVPSGHGIPTHGR